MQRVHILRLAVLLIPLLGGCVGLVRHLYGLQVENHEALLAEAQKCYTTRKRSQGQRGRIFDESGQTMLAGNIICRTVLAEPRRFPEDRREEIIAKLATELGLAREELRERFDTPLVEVTVARDVSLEKIEQLKRHELPGIRWTDSFQRLYAKGQLLASMLGFVDYEGRGVYGLEYLLDDLLAPVTGSTIYERDRSGHRLQGGRYEVEREARNGLDVYLTIEEPIQRIVEEELERMVKEYGAVGAYAVMIRPTDGAVLAVAQFPSYDPNDRRSMVSSGAWGIGPIQHMFEPGSVMKGISIAGALDYGVVGIDDVIDCEESGYWRFGGGTLTDTHRCGLLAVWEILRESSNIGAGKIGLEMGYTRLYNTMRRFGVGRRTGLGVRDLVGWRAPADRAPGWSECGGALSATKHWYPITPTRVAIGYNVAVTPIQLASAYAALANGGVRMEPRLVERIVDPASNEVRRIAPRVAAVAVRPETAATMTKALVSVTGKEGTAPEAAIPGFQVAGKTGTARCWVPKSGGGGSYSSTKYIASFVGYVPAEQPEFVLAIMANEPTKKHGYYGGKVAAPTFHRIAVRALRYLQVAPTESEEPTEATTRGQLAQLP